MNHCAKGLIIPKPLTFAELGIEGDAAFWRNWVKRVQYLEQCRIANAELRRANTPCRSYWYGDDGGDLTKRKYDYRQCFVANR